MLIDWFTVGAQVLNFAILAWLLKRFLYKPVLDAIDAREKGIAAKVAAADAKQRDAEREHDEFTQKSAAFDRERVALLGKATDEARAERQRLLDAARVEADALGAKRKEQLGSEARELHQMMRDRTQEEVFSIARRTLADLAGVDLERRICGVFADKLRALSGEAKQAFAEALKTASGPALVRSAFALPVEQQGAIRKALNETFSGEINVRFETAPELVGGIELTASGRKLSWSISDYLDTLQQGVDDLLEATVPPDTTAAA